MITENQLQKVPCFKKVKAICGVLPVGPKILNGAFPAIFQEILTIRIDNYKLQ